VDPELVRFEQEHNTLMAVRQGEAGTILIRARVLTKVENAAGQFT
jgi:hypothetical protein